MFLKVLKQELALTNCGIDHDPADAIVRSQWQRTSKSNNYLIYRWLVAAFVIAVEIIALYFHLQKRDISLFFIYLTRWGITINMIVGILGAILVTIWHYHADFNGTFLCIFLTIYQDKNINLVYFYYIFYFRKYFEE